MRYWIGRNIIKTQGMNKTFRPHDDAVLELLREDPAFADEYLSAALEEADQSGGRQALLAALRHIAEAQGMSAVPESCLMRLNRDNTQSTYGCRVRLRNIGKCPQWNAT